MKAVPQLVKLPLAGEFEDGILDLIPRSIRNLDITSPSEKAVMRSTSLP